MGRTSHSLVTAPLTHAQPGRTIAAMSSTRFVSLGLLPLVASLILLAGFWFDASYTLCVRMMSGQKFVQAHRSHLYQQLAAKKGHRWTTLVYAAFAVVWLLPLAAFSANFPQLNVVWLALSISPMAAAAWYFQAGRPQHRETPSTLA